MSTTMGMDTAIFGWDESVRGETLFAEQWGWMWDFAKNAYGSWWPECMRSKYGKRLKEYDALSDEELIALIKLARPADHERPSLGFALLAVALYVRAAGNEGLVSWDECTTPQEDIDRIANALRQ